jgi:hypothetical protein
MWLKVASPQVIYIDRTLTRAWCGLTSADDGPQLGSRRPTAGGQAAGTGSCPQESSQETAGGFPAPLPLPRLMALGLESRLSRTILTTVQFGRQGSRLVNGHANGH